ncbi:hypothetical protein Lal_00033756 [Lupinus albus]|nr:hypothetical protein Lal_00033756 [Lupinus albus]
MNLLYYHGRKSSSKILETSPTKSKLLHRINAISMIKLSEMSKGKHIANHVGNEKLVLPIPAFNVINGGSHVGNKLAMQANDNASMSDILLGTRGSSGASNI